MYPRIEQLRKDGYLVYVYDIDEYPELKEQYKLSSVPVTVIIGHRQESKRFEGITEAADITKHLVKEADQNPAPPDKYNFNP